MPYRFGCGAFTTYYIVGCFISVSLLQCSVDYITQHFRLIVFYLGIDVHRDLTVFMASQILNSFRVNLSRDQICDVGVPQLMGMHIKVQAVNDLVIMRGGFSENRMQHMLDLLTIHIAVISSLLCSSRRDVCPHTFELRVGILNSVTL